MSYVVGIGQTLTVPPLDTVQFRSIILAAATPQMMIVIYAKELAILKTYEINFIQCLRNDNNCLSDLFHMQFAPEAINCENKISDATCTNFFKAADIGCSSVTPDMCTHPTWRPIMAENCLKKCGLCADTDRSATSSRRECSDAIPGCHIDPSICFNNQLQDFVKANCKRTCGYCKDSATASPLISKTQFTTK
ncbi:shTK domain protein [Dictyocaulus viviparus]|uniref:ShTK domain protein n=1 Tax=Dictyocaulus viviparus TaxID=29172 RepID=A0A0D8X6W3_DICVI|nr:shTK domain protein [Dictyocaulus viviparus]